jgi:hypothetical protein
MSQFYPVGSPRARPVLTDPRVVEALAHPVRLDVLDYLMSSGRPLIAAMRDDAPAGAGLVHLGLPAFLGRSCRDCASAPAAC